MKKLSLYIFLGLMFSLFTSHSFAAKKHKIYKKLPCHFNGVKVETSAQLHSGVKGGRCCPECKGYKKKRGTSMGVKRGTPVVAIADMKVLAIKDDSGEQRTTSYAKKYGKIEGKDFYSKKKMVKPFDAMRIYFVDTKGNVILYYHLKETPLVPGFNKGKCKIPLEYEWGHKTFRPKDCGGYSKELIKNNLNVKKGQVIGLSGHAYNAHFSLGIAVPPDEEFRNFILKIIKNIDEKKILFTGIETKYSRLALPFLNQPYSFTGKYMRYTAPQRDFKWENLPTDSDAYLFPVMSKKYLKEIGYKK